MVDNVLDPTVVRGLPHVDVTINGNGHTLDANGMVSTSDNGGVTATIPLSGTYAIIYQGANGTSVPTMTTTLASGSNAVIAPSYVVSNVNKAPPCVSVRVGLSCRP